MELSTAYTSNFLIILGLGFGFFAFITRHKKTPHFWFLAGAVILAAIGFVMKGRIQM